MAKKKPTLSPDETGLLEAVREDLSAAGPQLVYADWLEERGMPAQAEFLRLRASVPAALRDGDTAEERQELKRLLEARASLRERKKALSPDWLRAVGDRGLVGEVLSYVTHFYGNTAYFGVIVAETAKTVTVASLGKRLVSPDYSSRGLSLPKPPIPAGSGKLGKQKVAHE